MAKEEVLIVPGKAESVFVNGDWERGFTEYVTNRWDASAPIAREPAYIAIFVSDTKSVQVVAELDYKRSQLDKGLIAMNNPQKVCIPIRFGKDTLQKFRYTTFRKLLTHETTDDL